MKRESFDLALEKLRYTDQQSLRITLSGDRDEVRGKLQGLENEFIVLQIKTRGLMCVNLKFISSLEIAD